MGDMTNQGKHSEQSPSFILHMSKTHKRSPEMSSTDESDNEEGSYISPVKKVKFEPRSTGDLESKPVALIYRQSSCSDLTGKGDEARRKCLLRPATLQAPASKPHTNTRCEGKDERQFSEKSTRTLFLNNSRHSSQSKEVETESPERQSRVAECFVFGPNTKERTNVVADCTEENTNVGITSKSNLNYFLQYSAGQNSKNGSSEENYVFGENLLAKVQGVPQIGSSTEATRSDEFKPMPASLAEAAAAYTKTLAKKVTMEKVDVKTGEESENNVLQINCKLYLFEKTARSWKDRGQGLLRLNDMVLPSDGTLESRLVMRTYGSLRLILNTKLWSGMQVKKASQKSVQVTAMDTEDNMVKVFLISGGSKEIELLVVALDERIMALHGREVQEPGILTCPEEPPSTSTDHISDAGDD